LARYELDPNHSTVGFSAKHLAVATVRGRFTRFEGQFEGPVDDATKVSGDARVEVASITTNTDQRDNHLLSADFFEAEKYPYITFKITSIEKKSADKYAVRGDLTIKATTKPITLDATVEGRIPDPFGGKERIGVTATGQLNRMDFGLNWDGIAGAVPIASHNIKLEIDAAIVVKEAELVPQS
jgi:polyisoprenoid-binding protein YceI